MAIRFCESQHFIKGLRQAPSPGQPRPFEADSRGPWSGRFTGWTAPSLAARNLITLNVPDAADMEELMKESANIPKGAWPKVQFTPSLIWESCRERTVNRIRLLRPDLPGRKSAGRRKKGKP